MVYIGTVAVKAITEAQHLVALTAREPAGFRNKKIKNFGCKLADVTF